jgi:hypothetical protein
MNRAWRGLASASRVEESPLVSREEEFLFLTATDEALRAHVRHVALRQGPMWNFRVVTDADLMTAWLSPASLLGKEILDPDAAAVSAETATLVDLIVPPNLLIVRLGVKSARNSAMGEVLLETLRHRIHRERPMWLVDQPARRLGPGHLAYDEEVVETLRTWTHVTLEVETSKPSPSTSNGGESRVLSLGEALAPPEVIAPSTTTRRVAVPAAKIEKKRTYGRSTGDR